MQLEIVTIGDELLLGFTVDTNAAHLARELAGQGVRVVHRTTVGDDADHIAAAVQDALNRTGAVITTGGLGPTADDRTKPAVAALFDREMVLDEAILSALEQRWLARFGQPMPQSNRQQAMVPHGAEILHNRHGSAPGIWLEDAQNRWVAMLPGVPREMRGMFADTLRDRIRATTPEQDAVVRSLTLRTASLSESAAADRLGDIASGVNGLSLAFLPGIDGVDLRVTSMLLPSLEADTVLRDAATQLRARIGQFVYGENDDDLAAIILSECVARNHTIAAAESCTGGLVGARLTAVPGASRVMQGGVVAYANAVKTNVLGVDPEDIERYGAVSEPVARAMATGVRGRLGTSIGLAITGIAGPDGGTPEKPVGTVWVAVDVEGDVYAAKAVLPGDRNEIRHRAAQLVLDRLRRVFLQDAHSDAWTVRA